MKKEVTAEEVNQAFEDADLNGVLAVSDEPLVSVDFNTNPNSAIVDAMSTLVMDDKK